jgi:arginyl-tRNA synthetase
VYKFPEVVQEAAEKYAPNLICNFVFDLAQKYNTFYNTHPVLSPYGRSPEGRQAPTKDQQQFRLQLTAASAQLICNSLRLLGIKTLERM